MLRHLVLAVAFVTVTTSVAHADPMTGGERQRLIAHLEMTEAWLVSELALLSDAQLAFKMTTHRDTFCRSARSRRTRTIRAGSRVAT